MLDWIVCVVGAMIFVWESHALSLMIDIGLLLSEMSYFLKRLHAFLSPATHRHILRERKYRMDDIEEVANVDISADQEVVIFVPKATAMPMQKNGFVYLNKIYWST